jgi:hypothetical protein
MLPAEFFKSNPVDCLRSRSVEATRRPGATGRATIGRAATGRGGRSARALGCGAAVVLPAITLHIIRTDLANRVPQALPHLAGGGAGKHPCRIGRWAVEAHRAGVVTVDRRGTARPSPIRPSQSNQHQRDAPNPTVSCSHGPHLTFLIWPTYTDSHPRLWPFAYSQILL